MVALERTIDKYIGAGMVLIVSGINTLLQALLFPIRILRPIKGNMNSNAKLIKNILVIKLWAVGDSVVSLPMLKALKATYPQAKITVLARKRNKDVYESCKYADKVMLFEDFSEVVSSARKYDIVIDLEPYLNISSLLAYYLGKQRIGFGGQLRSLLYHKKVKFTGTKHFAQVYMDMAAAAGANSNSPENLKELVQLQVPAASEKSADKILRSYSITKKDRLCGICVGVAESAKSREWPLERFSKVADKILDKKYCDKIIFIGGKAENEMIEKVIAKMKRKHNKNQSAINLAGKTSLKESFHIIKKCRLFISNDTGPMHIAAAQGCKTIGLFGPNTPVLWSPYGSKNIAIYKGEKVCKYSPCIRNMKGHMPKCRLGDNKCMKAITVADVMTAVKRIENS